MSSKDQVLRFIFDNTDIRGEVTTLNKCYFAATHHQELSNSLKKVLGEFLAAAVLMSQTLKFNGTLTVQARGDGALSLIMADVSNNGDVRGILQQNQDTTLNNISQLNLPELIGKGVLSIIISPERGERYQGIIPLEHPTLAECLSSYFENSEQLPTKLWLFANDQNCGGIFLQRLPAQKVTDDQKRKDQWETAIQLAQTTTENELFELDHTQLLYRIFNEMNCRAFKAENLQFNCKCGLEKGEEAIISLGEKDARQLILEQSTININCQFCGQKYGYKNNDLDRIFKRKSLH